MLESREALSVDAANVLDVLDAIFKVRSSTRAFVDRLPPLRLPRRSVPLLLLEVDVDCPTDHGRTSRSLRSGSFVQPRSLVGVEINLRAIHDV